MRRDAVKGGGAAGARGAGPGAAVEAGRPVAVFTIFGKPAPKQRPRVGKNGRVYTPRITRDYELKVAWSAKAAGLQPLAGPVEVRVAFYFAARPPGDLDNYLKALLDGMKGIAYDDDGQVVKLAAEARRCRQGEERAEVEVREVLPAEACD